jgi:hypothetical protein
VRVLETAQAELVARVLPRLALAVPMKAKLRQLLPNLGGGLFLERHPNPIADNYGEFPKAGVAFLHQGEDFFSRERPVFLPCFGIALSTDTPEFTFQACPFI